MQASYFTPDQLARLKERHRQVGGKGSRAGKAVGPTGRGGRGPPRASNRSRRCCGAGPRAALERPDGRRRPAVTGPSAPRCTPSWTARAPRQQHWGSSKPRCGTTSSGRSPWASAAHGNPGFKLTPSPAQPGNRWTSSRRPRSTSSRPAVPTTPLQADPGMARGAATLTHSTHRHRHVPECPLSRGNGRPCPANCRGAASGTPGRVAGTIGPTRGQAGAPAGRHQALGPSRLAGSAAEGGTT